MRTSSTARGGTTPPAPRPPASWPTGWPDPTGTGAENELILGDLNAYAQEDPIQALEAAGYTDVAGSVLGEESYSYVFDGQVGTLDYILANGPAFGQVAESRNGTSMPMRPTRSTTTSISAGIRPCSTGPRRPVLRITTPSSLA